MIVDNRTPARGAILALLFCSVSAAGCSDDVNNADEADAATDASMTPDAGPMPDAFDQPDVPFEPDVLDETCVTSEECTDPAAPWCSPEGACEPEPRGALIGFGQDVTLSPIYTHDRVEFAAGLEFNPEAPEQLWVVHRKPSEGTDCNDQATATYAGCAPLEGVVTIIFHPGTPEQTSERRVDGNAWHFMRRPSGIAFGVNHTFATCGEARTGNFLGGGPDFIGPTLWSSRLDIFAQDPGLDENGQPLNGSHLDMLHATPYCMGIAHQEANVYWAFNGQIGALDRYDFKEDHGPGYHDHSDGEIYRFAMGELDRVPDVPSHMYFDQEANLLYVADTGNARIITLDPSTGTEVVGGLMPVYEDLAANVRVDDAVVTEIVAPGTLQAPSGLVHHDGVLYVADTATSTIHAFEMDGTPIRSVQLDVAMGSLAALTVGPDEKLYAASLSDSTVWRIDP